MLNSNPQWSGWQLLPLLKLSCLNQNVLFHPEKLEVISGLLMQLQGYHSNLTTDDGLWWA